MTRTAMHILPALLMLTILSGCCTSWKRGSTALSESEAHTLAEKLAVANYGDMFGEAAFRNSRPPKLVSGQWIWHLRRGSGLSDIEIRVTFAQDGSFPVVDYQCLGSAEYIR